jgi:hypothetical protein
MEQFNILTFGSNDTTGDSEICAQTQADCNLQKNLVICLKFNFNSNLLLFVCSNQISILEFFEQLLTNSSFWLSIRYSPQIRNLPRIRMPIACYLKLLILMLKTLWI